MDTKFLFKLFYYVFTAKWYKYVKLNSKNATVKKNR